MFLCKYLFLVAHGQKRCAYKQYGQNAFTCVCNSTYCDTVPPIGNLGSNQAAIFVSSASGKRFEFQTQMFNQQASKIHSLYTSRKNNPQK